MSDQIDPEIIQDWQWSVEVLSRCLMQIAPGMSEEWYRKNVDAMIAQLASHEPPLLICRPDRMKE